MIFRKKINGIIKLLIAWLLALTGMSCSNPVFDYEGDCGVHHYLRFVYNMNLKWADAFPSEVHSVNLYAFNERGLFVKEYLGRGEDLSKPDYTIELDLSPGKYTLVAWCGLYNDGIDMGSFTVPTPEPGVTTLDELNCSLNTLRNNEYDEYSDTEIKFMYHGILDVDLVDTQDGMSYDYTMYLTKDTNHIRVILQQLSGEDMDPADFSFRLEAPNGEMDYDNSLVGDQTVNYLAWDKFSGEAGIFEGTEGEGDLIYADGVVADLSTCRMMADQSKVMKLTIFNDKTGDVIASVPVIQYALMAKEYYETAYGHQMTNQEFLDREDEYVLTFFLDKDDRWIDSYVYINSWRIVLHSYDI